MGRVLRSLFLLALVGLVSVAFVFAGGGQEEEQVIEDEEAASQFEGLVEVDRTAGFEVGEYGGTFTVSTFGSDPKTFNTVVAAETSSTDITGRLYAGVFRRNQLTLEWETWAAESYEISDDETQITVTLREGMEWSDGEPVTAADWVDAVNTVYMDEAVETNSRNALIIQGEPTVWEQIDELTFRVTFPQVYAGIFNTLTVSPLPMHVFGPLVENEGAAAVNSFWGVDADVTEIVGNGPWTIAGYEPGQRVRLARNENYFETDQEGNQLPYLDEVVIVYVSDQDTQLQRFLAGDLDWYGLRGEDYAVLIDEKDNLGFEMYNVGPDSGTQFITFNQNPIEGEGDAGIEPPELTWLSNKQFRIAMAHVVDRQTIIDNIAFGFGYPQYSFIPPYSPYYWEGAEDIAYKYNPERAREILDSTDYVDRDGDGVREDPDGNKISLELNTNSGNRVREAIGELFAQEAASVGIEVNFRPEDFNSLVGKLVSSYDWELILIGLTGSVDPISGANVYPSDGNLHMIEPGQEEPRREWEKQVDEAWGEANFTTDEQERFEGWQKIQELWIENVPWVYTFNAAIMHAWMDGWANVKPQPVDGYGALHNLIWVYQQ